MALGAGFVGGWWECLKIEELFWRNLLLTAALLDQTVNKTIQFIPLCK